MKNFYIIFSLLFSLNVVNAQITHYSTSNTGLLSNNISAIAIDSYGNKWFANYEAGVTKYNDTTWTTFTTSNSGLIHNAVHTLAIDAQDNVWIGTWDGLSKYDGTIWTNYTTANGLLSGNVLSIAFDGQGNKWIGTSGGVSKFDDNTWTHYTINSGLADSSVYAVAIDSSGNKWFGTPKGITKFDNTNWTTYLNNQDIISIAVDTQNKIWAGTGRTQGDQPQMGVFIFDGNNWTSTLVGDISSDTTILTIVLDALGNIWFGGELAVSMYNGSAFSMYNDMQFPGFNGYNFKAITFDSQGNKWFGHQYGVIVLSSCGVPQAQNICYVEFDSTSTKNKINWQNNIPVNIDSILIYNEVSTNVWNLIGSVPAIQNNFIDLNSNPFNQSYSYKIAALDTCGNTSDFSPSHTTITLLAAYDQLSNAYGFTWSPYQGLPVANYYLYGVMANGTQTLIGSVPGNQYFFNYTNPYAGFVHYFVGFNTSPCNSKTDYLIKSNWVQSPNSIFESYNFNSEILTYPNPVKDIFYIQHNLDIKDIEIYNALGQLVYIINNGFENGIDVSYLSQGVYTLKINVNKSIFKNKLLKLIIY